MIKRTVNGVTIMVPDEGTAYFFSIKYSASIELFSHINVTCKPPETLAKFTQFLEGIPNENKP